MRFLTTCLTLALVATTGSVSLGQVVLSGSLEAGNSFEGNGALNPNQTVSCIEVFIPQDILASSGDFFEVNTNGSTDTATGFGADTELLLFNGNLAADMGFVFSDDDGGDGLTSGMSFGDGSGAANGATVLGEDGDILAGTYTFVIGEFSTNDPGVGGSLNDFLFVDGDNGDEAVDWNFEILTNVAGVTAIEVNHVPEPSTFTIVAGLGLCGLTRRRRS